MNIDSREIVSETERRLGYALNSAQRDAATLMMAIFRIVMPPGRGAGKTFLMNFLVECDKTLQAHRDMETL